MNKKIGCLVICMMMITGFIIMTGQYYFGKKNINVGLALDNESFIGWVEVMSPSGEYLEEESKLVENGHYVSLRAYAQGKILYVIAWVDLAYQIGNNLYVLGMRVPVTVQIDRQSFELSDGKLWLYPNNLTMFGENW